MPTETTWKPLPLRADPEDLFRAGPGRAENGFWLDAGYGATTGWSLMGAGESAEVDRALVVSGSPARTGAGLEDGWVGWLGYDVAAGQAGSPAHRDDSVPQSAWIRVDRALAFEHDTQRWFLRCPAEREEEFRAQVTRWVEQIGDAAPTSDGTPVVARARHDARDYARLIEQCRDAIHAGDAYQLCLTTRFSVDHDIDPVAAYLTLRRTAGAARGGVIRIGDHALVSASPETFLEIAGGVVRTRPIKGTRGRGATPEADATLSAELLASTKERAENVMIVDLMRNDLQQVCSVGSVRTEALLTVETYPTVHQLVSTIAGELRPGVTLAEVLDATFPAGSMTGAPKLSAMTILHDLEKEARGVFAGCFGWVDRSGAAELAMTIRSIVTHPGGAYVGAGGGITWGSRAVDEVAEVALKARGPLRAIGATLPPDWE